MLQVVAPNYVSTGVDRMVELITLFVLAFSAGYFLRGYFSYRRRGHHSRRFPYF
jgi:hypothetical protein